MASRYVSNGTQETQEESVTEMKAKIQKLEAELSEARSASFSSNTTNSSFEEAVKNSLLVMQNLMQQNMEQIGSQLVSFMADNNKNITELNEKIANVELIVSKSPTSKSPAYVQDWVNRLPEGDLNEG